MYKYSKTLTRVILMAGGSTLGLCGFAGVAAAQDATENAGADNSLIIVTATKRETTLQELPLSVSVTSAETIEQAQIRDLLDLQTVAPSLRVSQFQNAAATNFIIRGFGNGANNPGIEPSVGVFIDGVYRSRSGAQIGDLANVARVEVLRGPQSTLFGKNASAGVISIVTREPQFEFGGSVEASYGNFNAIVLKGDVTGPITEKLAFSIDGGYNKRDGYATIANLDTDVSERNRWNLRGQLLFEPSPDFTVRLIGDYSSIDEDCCLTTNVVGGPTVPAIFGVGGALAVGDPFTSDSFLNQVPVNEIDNYGFSMQADWTTGPITITSISAYRNGEAFIQGDIDYTTADVASSNSDTKIDTITQELRVASDFDGPLNFLLGGYYFNEDIEVDAELFLGPQSRDFFNLLTGGALGGAEAALGITPGSSLNEGILNREFFTLDNEAYSVFGTVDFEVTDRLTLTAGFNYTKDKKSAAIQIETFDELAQVNLVDAVIVGQLVPFLGANASDPAAIATFAAAPATAPIFDAIAAAAQNPAVNPLLGLSGLQFQPPFLNFPNAVENGRTNDSDFSYTLRAAYEINDNINAYFSYSTGFKASSFNLSRNSRPFAADFTPGGPFRSTLLAPSSPILDAGLAVPNLNSGTRFAAPEEAEVYEIGIKAQFDGLAVNLALFDQTLKGFQSNTFTGTGFSLANAGEQSTKGVEFDARIQPADPLVFTFALTYLDAVYDSFPGSALGDLTGQDVQGIAPISISTSATYTHEFGSGTQLIGRIDYSHESNVSINNGLPTFGPTAQQLFKREQNLVNGGLSLRLTNGLELSLWGRNLLNDRFLVTVFDGVAQAGTVSAFPNQPRTYGGTVRFKF